jgi:hypothetical protein
MSDVPRTITPGSREEAHVAESILYGLLGAMVEQMKPLLQTQFSLRGATLHRAEEHSESPVIFDGLTIHMASGDYRVTIEQEKVRA